MKKIFILLCLTICFYTSAQENPFEAYKTKMVGQLAPDFKFKDISGKEFMLSDLKGKVVLMNCWFINCSGCRIEYPGLQTLKARFKDQSKVVFLSLALDGKELLQNFLKKNPLNFQHMAAAGDISQGTYNALGFPSNFIINQEGKISHIKIGGSPQSADDIEYEMKELLKKGQ
jgi:peroxiredoxin